MIKFTVTIIQDLDTSNYNLHTGNYTLHTINYTLHTVNYTLHAVNYTEKFNSNSDNITNHNNMKHSFVKPKTTMHRKENSRRIFEI